MQLRACLVSVTVILFSLALLASLDASAALTVSVEMGPDRVRPGEAVTAQFTVANNGGSAVAGVVLQAPVPVGITSINPALITPTVSCPATVSNNFLCDATEVMNWTLGTIGAGATVAVSMPTTVIAGLTNGRLMYLDARVNDDQGRLSTQSRTALVAPFIDGDGDLVADIYDNCPVFANPTQTDTDLDGRGDDCECGDQSGDGRNTVSDLVEINIAIFNPGLVTPLCDANNDQLCNVNDIIEANIEIFSPTSTSTCARYPVPGP